ncbi:hypothetical protein AK812_SmicGene45638, partial [Symbiodinium microadriaticum]
FRRASSFRGPPYHKPPRSPPAPLCTPGAPLRPKMSAMTWQRKSSSSRLLDS